MIKKEFYFPSADGKTNIHAVTWEPEGKPRAVLQISHGVTEHMLRYEELAEYFTQRGIMVMGNDHLGHGLSIAEGAEPLYFGPENSWDWVVEDMYTCQKKVKEQYPDIPYVILGLSLGTFLIRTFLIDNPGEVSGVILVGTGQTPASQLSLVKWVAKQEAKKAGEDHTTPLIQQLSFGTYNKRFAPNRTSFDWLCSSEEGLNDYMEDPLIGSDISAGLFREMLDGMIFTGNLNNQKKMDMDIPILLISGEEDPVGDSGKGVKRTYQSFQKAGVKDVSMKLYPGLRHDLFLENEKQDVFEEIYKWVDEKCLAGRNVNA